jgi:hypothetical protein
MEDANAKVGRETVHQPTKGKHSLRQANGDQKFVLHAQKHPSPNLMDTPSIRSFTA